MFYWIRILSLSIARDNETSKAIEEKHQIFSGDNRLFISVVTLGEINSIIKKFKLGKRRVTEIYKILTRINKLGIEYEEIIERYGDIDDYSQNNNEFTSRNMGKNDLWIAATANAFNIKLITADKDFHHLKDGMIDLLYINLETMKSKNG